MKNLDTMTTAQLCDWHAERAGWTETTVYGEKEWWKYTISLKHGGRTYSKTHPFPPTRDGAASAMPEGWEWRRRTGYTLPIVEWMAFKPGASLTVSTPDTGDETRDRYLLAALAVMKEAGE